MPTVVTERSRSAGYTYASEIVVERHQGKITCQSELNRVTEFALALPTVGIARLISHT